MLFPRHFAQTLELFEAGCFLGAHVGRMSPCLCTEGILRLGKPVLELEEVGFV